MAQQVKVSATKQGYLSSIPRNYIVKEKINTHKLPLVSTPTHTQKVFKKYFSKYFETNLSWFLSFTIKKFSKICRHIKNNPVIHSAMEGN